MNIHTVFERFKCDLCKRLFRQESSVREHVAKLHNKRNKKKGDLRRYYTINNDYTFHSFKEYKDLIKNGTIKTPPESEVKHTNGVALYRTTKRGDTIIPLPQK